jgi:BirA family transcriptional regulator, biotin operon repressor / biotin---[acetyl-CoA-carboxylase] ligase
LSAIFTNKIIGHPFVKLNSVDSTNNYAMQKAKSGMAKHGTVYFAHMQTAGKGQRNKQWLSAKDENIILSVILDTTPLLLSQQVSLSIVSALAALNLFNNYTTNNLKIKWPNDIYWQDRKTGGILIENIIAGDVWKSAIAGFGLNINETVFDTTLKNPASLKQITGKDYNVIELAYELCSILEKKFYQLLNGGFENLMNEYNENLYKKNETVRFKKETKVFDGRIIRVDEAGRLIVHTACEEAFEFGSVEWIMES